MAAIKAVALVPLELCWKKIRRFIFAGANKPVMPPIVTAATNYLMVAAEMSISRIIPRAFLNNTSGLCIYGVSAVMPRRNPCPAGPKIKNNICVVTSQFNPLDFQSHALILSFIFSQSFFCIIQNSPLKRCIFRRQREFEYPFYRKVIRKVPATPMLRSNTAWSHHTIL